MKNILLDCDGVLYPLSELSAKDIIKAVKETYRHDLKLNGEEQAMISAQTYMDGRLGLYNYIKAICEYKDYDFDKFCTNMTSRIDYRKINPNQNLWYKLQQLTAAHNVAIFSNNSIQHIEKVTERLFDKDIKELEGAGIKVFGIGTMQEDGWFLPKKSRNGLAGFILQYNYNPAETILLDDSKENVSAARKIGMRATLISADNTLEKNIQQLMQPHIGKGKIYE